MDTEAFVEDTDVVEEPSVLTSVDLNTATADELRNLPGIGEYLAAQIIEYREEHGLFQTTEDLMQVPGIGDTTYVELLPQLTVSFPEDVFDADTPVEEADTLVDEIIFEEAEVTDLMEEDELAEPELEAVPLIEEKSVFAPVEPERFAEVEEPELSAPEIPPVPEPEPMPEVPPPPPPAPRRERKGNWGWVWGALLGGLLGMILALLVFSGINGSLDFNHSYAMRDVRSTLDSLDAGMDSLNGDLDDISARLDNLESVTGRVSKVENDIKSLRDEADSLTKRAETLAGELEAVQGSVEEVTVTVEEMQVETQRVGSFFEGLQKLLSETFSGVTEPATE